MKFRLIILVVGLMAGLNLMADDNVKATQDGLATVLSNSMIEESIDDRQ